MVAARNPQVAAGPPQPGAADTQDEEARPLAALPAPALPAEPEPEPERIFSIERVAARSAPRRRLVMYLHALRMEDFVGPKTKMWLKGLMAAVIGAAAQAGATVVTAPEVLYELGWVTVGKICGAAALIAFFNYLKESPVPNGKAAVELEKAA